jgi:hypothetical protein
MLTKAAAVGEAEEAVTPFALVLVVSRHAGVKRHGPDGGRLHGDRRRIGHAGRGVRIDDVFLLVRLGHGGRRDRKKNGKSLNR